MCGIGGAVALSADRRPDVERVRRMSRLLCHRGPDGEGIWTAPSGRACFAHRRLSIIDLETGQQPMVTESGAAGIVFNGEIYNYLELRRELEARGARFHTTSDTEVLLRAYELDGPRCVDALRGMFAFVIWDDRRERLFMARDRVGKKPLYYVIDDGVLYFASTLRALAETAEREWEIDPAAVDAFLTLGYIPAPGTIYRGVSKLEAATTLVLEGAERHVERFWDLAEADSPFDGTYAAAVDRLDELIHTAVALRLRSDVPLGVFLSGGIDSSLVAAVAAAESKTPVLTFSIGFGESAFDESGFAAEVARRLGTRHRTFHGRPDLLEFLPEMVRHFGEPFGDSSALNVWLLARETRPHVTVGLGGDGGDEGFGGYNWYRNAARLDGISRLVPSAPAQWVSRLLAAAADGGVAPRRAGQMGRGLDILAMPEDARRFAALRAFMAPRDASRLYAGALAEARAETGGEAHRLLAELYERAEGSALRRMRYVDIRTYLADGLMPKVDVATMAHGLEARAPLLDQEVLRFALRLPDDWIIGPSGGKRILRDVLYRYLPASLFDRPKQGFAVPLPTWFAGSLRQSVEQLPLSPRLLETGWFDPRGIRALIDEHVAGVREHSQRLFNLLVLDQWLAGRETAGVATALSERSA